MVATLAQLQAASSYDNALLSPEQRVVFYDLSWQAYEQLLSALGDSRTPRLTYDQRNPGNRPVFGVPRDGSLPD